MADVVFVASLVVALAGLVALLAVIIAWRRIEELYQAAWPKGVIALARFVAACAAIASRIQPPPQSEGNPFAILWSYDWGRACLAAALAWLLWELTDVVAGWRSVGTVHRKKSMERIIFTQAALLVSLRRLVNEKKLRACNALGASDDALNKVRNALQPRRHLYLVLESLGLFLRGLNESRESPESAQQNFRIGIYVSKDGVLAPLFSVDLNDRKADPFPSYAANSDRFRLENKRNPSQTVKCITERSLLIVEDCVKASESGDGTFAFFHGRQANYLKSMISFPILDFRNPDGQLASAAVSVDTDVSGFFREDDRQLLNSLMDEFVARLNFESHLGVLLGSGDAR